MLISKLRSGRSLLASTAAFSLLISASQPAPAQTPTLKELLEKAQSKSDSIVVEDIVGKLRPKAPEAPGVKPSPEPAAAVPISASPPPPLPIQAAPLPVSPPVAVTPTVTVAPAVREQPAATAPPLPVIVAPSTPPPVAVPPVAVPAVTVPAIAVPQPAPSPPVAVPALATSVPTAPPAADARPAPPAPATAVDTVAPVSPRIEEAVTAPSIDLEILFGYDRDEISATSHPLMIQLGRALADARLSGRRFHIAGHTDGKGRAEYNLALSERRARAVRDFLVVNFNIDRHRLTFAGYGKSRLKNTRDPLAPENRRVQIVSLPDQQR